MKEFVKMAGAVAVGTLVASGVAMKLLLNKKFMKGYTKKVLELSEELMNETIDYADEELE